MPRPILYSFRRCPYAMRARLAIWQVGVECEHREVVLRDKPPCMVVYSEKATVPVLVLEDGTVIDESLQVMYWALAKTDHHPWLTPETGDEQQMRELIERNDTEFKTHLDRYKYPTRYTDVDPDYHRDQAQHFLADLDARICEHGYLCGSLPVLADFAIVPFVRQFANIDRAWFDATGYQALQAWLESLLTLPLFEAMMQKFPQWQTGAAPRLVP